jgi:hypothetical protein
MLAVVLYGYETWSLTLREEHRQRMFENRVLRRIFGPKKNEVTREWRKLHSEELHTLHSSKISLGRSNQGERGGQGMSHAWECRGMCTEGFDGKARRKDTTWNTKA